MGGALSAPRRRLPLLRRSAGFTLLEMLAALSLFALASALIWPALAALARIELRLADSRFFAVQVALRAEWLRRAVGGAVSGPAGESQPAKGDRREFVFLSTAPPWPGSQGPEAVRLALEPREGQTHLYASPAAWHAGVTPPRWHLWGWPGEGAWRYLDHAGQWRDDWPPSLDAAVGGPPPPRLPRAVALVGAPGGTLVMAIVAGDNPMPRRRDVEQ